MSQKTTAQSKRPRKAPSNQTGGTAWGKKAAAAISGRMQSADVKKLILLNFPYIIAFYMVEKAAWLYRHCNGDTIVDKLMVLFMNFGLAYKSYLPSVHPFDLLVGLIGAAALKAVIYFKGKNAKKYRQGEEYGSARWGNAKDIEPFIDPVFENNVLLTQTERLMMSGRPKHPKYARNKNVIVIGGSGSGKTRFFVKPNLMQMPEKVSYVCTDPKGTIIIELKIVQELYEEKLVTYPRTDSQYITEDMQQTMTDLLKHYGGETDGVKQVVNNKKVTDHHAILPTLESCKRGSNSLSRDKEKVFALIVWKMQQAVQPPYIYEDVLVTVCCQDRKFTAKYKNVLQAGHTAIPVPFAEQEKSKDMAFPKKLEQGEVIPVVSAEKKQGFTSPPKAFTEDTLLSAMETAGNKEFEKGTEKKGLGTPATRAAILEKLVSSGYVERKGKQILPSAEGVTAIANIPDYLKSASMTAEWENELLRMERGETKPADFMQGIGGLLERMLADLRQIPTVQESTTYNKISIGDCPVCGNSVCEGRQNFYCSDRDCKFALWKESKYLSSMKKTLTKKMATDLLKKGRTHVKDFYSAKKDKTFAADLVMAIENGRAQYSLEFPKTPAKK